MRRTPFSTLATLGAAAMIALPQALLAAEVSLRRDSVIAVKFDREINVRDSRRGDTFTTTVVRDPDLPEGTRVLGRIAEIRYESDDRRDRRDREVRDGKATVRLEFTAIETPDGRRQNIQAIPVDLNGNFLSRNRDGRIEANRNKTKKEHVVLGGALGGLLLGALFDKPFEGTFVGALAGVILAETQSKGSGDVFVKKGAEMGALLERDVRVSWDDRYNRYNNRYDRYDERYDRYERADDEWRRSDRYDRRDDVRRDDRFVIEYGRRELRFDRGQEPYRVGNTIMVPLERTAAQMGLDLDSDRNGRWFTISDDDQDLEIELDSRTYRLNRRQGTLPQAVTRRDRTVYVPLDILAKMKRENVYVNGTKLEPKA